MGRTPIHYLFVKINDEYNNSDIDPVNTLTKLLEYEEVDPEYKDIYGNRGIKFCNDMQIKPKPSPKKRNKVSFSDKIEFSKSWNIVEYK